MKLDNLKNIDWGKIFLDVGKEFSIEYVVERMTRKKDRSSEQLQPMFERANKLVDENKQSEAGRIYAAIAEGLSEADERKMAEAEFRFLAHADRIGNDAPEKARKVLKEIKKLFPDQRQKVRLWITEGDDANEHLAKLVTLRKTSKADRALVYDSSDLIKRNILAEARTSVQEWAQESDKNLAQEVKELKRKNKHGATMLHAFGLGFLANMSGSASAGPSRNQILVALAAVAIFIAWIAWWLF